jgi:putative iron-regulated protein
MVEAQVRSNEPASGARRRPRGPLLLVAVALGPLFFGWVLTTRAPVLSSAPSLDEAQAREFLVGYADIAHAAYGDAHRGAQALTSACDALVAEPNEGRLSEARRAWLAARIPYLQTEVLRFYGGPIDAVETLVNTWPIDESYIESDDGTSGLVGDVRRYPDLTKELLSSSNLRDGETSVSTGYHAIELLLWGRDQSPVTAGTRPAGDFAGNSLAAKRRGTYLKLATRLLEAELRGLERAWAPDEPASFRSEFLERPTLRAVSDVIKGLGALGGAELAGERLTVPYETKDQENEHSCFSDSTTQDVVFDAVGIENVCLGRYQRVDGKTLERVGLCSLVARTDRELGVKLESQIRRSVEAARNIPAPFDHAILGKNGDAGRVAIHDTISALRAQTDTLTKAAEHLGAGPLLASALGQ